MNLSQRIHLECNITFSGILLPNSIGKADFVKPTSCLCSMGLEPLFSTLITGYFFFKSPPKSKRTAELYTLSS